MGKNLEIIRGTSNRFDITISDIKDNMYVLSAGEKILFGVKRKPTDTECVFLKTVTTGTDGVYPVEIDPVDTENLAPGKYFYDVGLQAGDEFWNVIEPSVFEIKPNITQRGETT